MAIEFSHCKYWPEWRRLDGCFNDGMSTSTRDDWWDLSEVTTAHKDPATARDGSLHQVIQASIDSLKHSPMTHWEFIPMWTAAIFNSSPRWLPAVTLHCRASSSSVTGILYIECAVVPPSWFNAARPVVAVHRTILPCAQTAAVMTFINRVLPLPDRPSTYINRALSFWTASITSFVWREQTQMSTHKLAADTSHGSISTVLCLPPSTHAQVWVVQSHS